MDHFFSFGQLLTTEKIIIEETFKNYKYVWWMKRNTDCVAFGTIRRIEKLRLTLLLFRTTIASKKQLNSF